MLGNFLKNKREAVGLSQGQVAKKLRYTSPQFISNWERGISSPPIKVLRLLSDLYRVSTDELFDLILQHSVDQLRSSLLKEYNLIIRKKKTKNR
jgi:transcriptional regulator with XRE-family HTH domain